MSSIGRDVADKDDLVGRYCNHFQIKTFLSNERIDF